MKLSLSFAMLLALSQSIWAESHYVNGKTIELKDKVINNNGHISNFTSAKNINDVEFKLENNYLSVPADSRFTFFRNNGEKDNVNTEYIVINKKMNDQFWKLTSGKLLHINCGKGPYSANFIRFTSRFELIEGCRSSSNQYIKGPHGSNIKLHKDAENLKLFSPGELRSANKVSGNLLLPKTSQRVKLAYGQSISFNMIKKIEYFHIEKGETFFASTEINEKTEFTQPKDMNYVPVFFHPNGQISSGIPSQKIIKDGYKFNFLAMNVPSNTTLGVNPIGFDQEGKINRVVLNEPIDVLIKDRYFSVATDPNTGQLKFGEFKSGKTFTFLKDTQLFFQKDSNGKNQLKSFSIQIEGSAVEYYDIYNEKDFFKTFKKNKS